MHTLPEDHLMFAQLRGSKGEQRGSKQKAKKRQRGTYRSIQKHIEAHRAKRTSHLGINASGSGFLHRTWLSALQQLGL